MDNLVGVIIQARMGSSRFPGKSMKTICNNPLIYYSFKKSSQAKYADKVIIATSNKIQDDIIEQWCSKNNVICFRGSEDDVLDRYYKCAIENNLDTVVRVTADNPFIDPEVIDLLILNLKIHNSDYVTMRHHTNTWPYGLDVEVVTIEALKKSWEISILDSHREHVTLYIKENEKEFNIREISIENNIADIRLTVDYEDDFNRATLIMKELLNTHGIYFSWRDTVKIYNEFY